MCNVDFVLDNIEHRKSVEVSLEKGKADKLYLFLGNEPVSGKVNVTLKEKVKKIEHTGIRVEFVGQIGRNWSASLLQ